MARLKVLISGGGIAGNALAFWLSKLGHKVTVVEWFPTLRAKGLQIDLRGHGIEVMKRMGLESAFRAKAAPENGIQVVDGSGRRRGFFAANTSGKGLQNFTSEFEIMRGDMCRILYEAARANKAEYVFGTSIEGFEEDKASGGGVQVRLANGSVDRYDLVVGADGQGSRTRRMMLGTADGADAADGFCPLKGVYTSYFTIDRQIQEGEDYIATAYIAPGRRSMMTRRHSPEQMQVYMGFTTDSEKLKNARGDVQKEKEALAEIMKGAGWRTEEFLRDLVGSDNFYLESMGFVRLESWTRGRVVLLGDAAYCPSATTGMGTTAAMVGAYVLAGEIERHCGSVQKEHVGDGIAAALTAYEQTFRPFIDQVTKALVDGDKNIFDAIMLTTKFGVGVLNFIVGIVSLLKFDVVAAWFLQEKVKWDLPEYKELL
ncbi:FAD/NAD(P)-binding domain-containing protein [Hypoxylon fragiforme]|uniref:FAD/NAD(P)-binding domain-containing protein n=1 Tax=Hypoxylon fragiforme TaxID=63214 RepID=UPI0020C745F2|nr:FAD/NAD(P)-binding domain-containing protein [Hypoxylon fragiforme]KAI2607313.1 FAD/NAD(P)-binding domain-containing protein [Hypoxylon fragiforme]